MSSTKHADVGNELIRYRSPPLPRHPTSSIAQVLSPTRLGKVSQSRSWWVKGS